MAAPGDAALETEAARPSVGAIVREWGRIGCLGFGGPPAHIAMLRRLCVDERRWITAAEFEDAIAVCNLLPGPASTQLAIYTAWRVRGRLGALVGGLAFILPGLVLILGLSVLFLAATPPLWVRGAGAGTAAAVAAVALRAGVDLVAPSWRRAPSRVRGALYLAAGGLAAATVGPWLVVVLLACGAAELAWSTGRRPGTDHGYPWAPIAVAVPSLGSLGGLVWTAFKVGALSYGGGFVIIPLMRADAVDQHRWMTDTQFLNAVALGQVTPGPVVQTVAVVGYAAAGVGGGLLAALVAFTPSFSFVLLGADHFDRLRRNSTVTAFLAGAGPGAIGAILGVTVPLTAALTLPWQYAVLAAAGAVLFVARRGVVLTLLLAGAAGIIAALAGAPLP
jgi:chromate transporter